MDGQWSSSNGQIEEEHKKRHQIETNTIEMNERFHSDASGANNFVVRSDRMNIEYFVSFFFSSLGLHHFHEINLFDIMIKN